jgi:glycosyltransferase involved in cell wall biosynthesis
MGLDVLVDAFARVHAKFPRAKLWLTGRGSAEEMLRARSESLGLAKRVRFLGFLADDDVPRLLNAADLTVMPSLDLEGFGLATAESLACGTPVVGSLAGATPELLEPLDSRLLFEAGSVDVLAERLSQYLGDPSSVPSRADCAAYARNHFSWDAQVEACEAAARDLVAGGSFRSPSKGSGSSPV